MMGDASVMQLGRGENFEKLLNTGKISDERLDCLIGSWRRNRIKEQGVEEQQNIRELKDRIERQKRR